jgi:hypothetical protein
LNNTLSRIIFLAPVLTVVISYFFSSLGGYVEWCFPLLDGCTSISKVGRYGVSFYLYKIFIIPSVILMIIFWHQINKYFHKSNLLLFLSVTSCIFLIIYLFALGFEGKFYRFMREIGIFVFFIFSPVSQTLLVFSISNNKIKSKFSLKTLLSLYFLFVVGYLLILPLDNSNYENMIEWNFALLIFLFFPLFTSSLRETNV